MVTTEGKVYEHWTESLATAIEKSCRRTCVKLHEREMSSRRVWGTWYARLPLYLRVKRCDECPDPERERCPTHSRIKTP